MCVADGNDFIRISVPVEVRLPQEVRFVPVRSTVNFSEWLRQMNIDGAIDERTLTLYEILPDGTELEQPVQFRSFPQPRPPQRRLSPGTPPSVSYTGEYAAGETPHPIETAGELTWIARVEDGNAELPLAYRLEFAVATAGKLIQVPFPPRNLRGFDARDHATPVRYFPRMQIRPQWPLDGAVDVLDNHALVTRYRIGPAVSDAPALLSGQPMSLRRPFLYPVNGPDGIGLTEFGKPSDPTGSHAHHYSLWIAHANVNGIDFWSERGGAIYHAQFDLLEDGPVLARIIQQTRWMFDNRALLHDRRAWTFYAEADDFRLIDLDLELSPAGAEPVEFGQTSFGFLAVRVAQSMTVFDGGGEILNAHGERNEQNAHLRRAEWIDQSGPIAPATWGGVTLMDHPDNPNHPTAWHCRNDGWAGASFNLEDPYILQPDETLRLRYRICLHRGDARQAGIDRRYLELQSQPQIHFGRPSRMEAHRTNVRP